MKKFLLLSALVLGSLAANAEKASDFFKVYWDGEEVPNNSQIVCTDYTDSGEKFGLVYDCNLNFRNVTDEWMVLYAAIGYSDQPTKEQFDAEKNNYIDGTYTTKWGTPSLCYAHAGENGDQDNCIVSPGKTIMPDSSIENFLWQVHLMQVPAETVAKYTLTVTPCYGDMDDFEEIEGADYTVTIVFATTHEAGVEGVDADINAAPEYFNLQGVRVAEPNDGLYIVKRGNKVSKEIVRK